MSFCDVISIFIFFTLDLRIYRYIKVSPSKIFVLLILEYSYTLMFTAMDSHPPIALEDLASHIERLKANDRQKFAQEYESIEPGQTFTWEASNLECNGIKNRYGNVIAYDHSRVLVQHSVSGSDYINANYMDGYCHQGAYIATQVGYICCSLSAAERS